MFVYLLRSGRTVVGRSDQADVSLPSEEISRVHCTVERRTEGWRLCDRSRHGTLVNGEVVTQHLLATGDVITLGPYSARFDLRVRDAIHQAITATANPMPPRPFEDLVDLRADGFGACRAELVFTGGPHEGRRELLLRSKVTVGGPSSVIDVDPSFPKNAMSIRVVRGRAMVEPGSVPVYLGGTRVREITPVHDGEELRLGQHCLALESNTVGQRASARESFGEMIGSSESMQRLFGVLGRAAAHEYPVLVTGESGTGKELAARALHYAGHRHDGPFVAINCGAIARDLAESELFGHEKGAFSGASQRRDGAFHAAHDGSIFLDEVAELPADLQASLLRVLENGEVTRVGANMPEHPDVRVIAATHRNLPEMVAQGTFRQDLYWRLNVLPVEIPPLRDRIEDIAPIARALLARSGRERAKLTGDAVKLLEEYHWPGNIRELRNVLFRAYVHGGPMITAKTLTFQPWAFGADAPAPRRALSAAHQAERQRLLEALRAAGGNRSHAARSLGMPRSTFLYKIKTYKIQVARS